MHDYWLEKLDPGARPRRFDVSPEHCERGLDINKMFLIEERDGT